MNCRFRCPLHSVVFECAYLLRLPCAHGFDSFFGWCSGWLDAYSHRYHQLGGPPGKIFHDPWRNETEVFEEPAYMTELLGREANTFLAAQSAQQPGDKLTDKVWLSNLESDLGETKNLAASEPARVEQLTRQIPAWKREVGLAPE